MSAGLAAAGIVFGRSELNARSGEALYVNCYPLWVAAKILSWPELD